MIGLVIVQHNFMEFQDNAKTTCKVKDDVVFLNLMFSIMSVMFSIITFFVLDFIHISGNL